jgi:hypothetical protein
MAKYKIVATPKFPGGGEVELDGYRYKKDASGKWFYSSGAPVTDPLLIQKLTYEAKPVGTPRPTPYTKPDVRTTDMKISAAKKKGMAYQSTLDELQALEQQKELERLAEQQRLAQAEADRLALENARMNAPFNKSETIQGTVAQLAPVTPEQRANVEASKREYNNKRSFLAERALDENYDAVAYDLAQDIKRDNPGLTFEEALSKAKADYDALKTKALNKYVTQDPDVLARVADERGYNTKSGPGNVTMKQQNLGDPNIVSFANPNSVEGYYNRGRDILLNPLDAFHYAMSPTESMPYNYKAYEEMKQRTGYQDGADKNLFTGAIDFASWFNPVGLYAQGVKMLPETVESVQRVIDNPTLGNAGTAAFDIGMNALTLAGGKSPLKFIAEETQAVRDAQFASDFMRGRRGPTPTNPGTGYLPIGLPSAEGSPLTNTVRSIDTGVTPYTVESYPTKKPLNIEETLASFSDEEPITRATVKKKSKGAQKQFLEDLQKDPDYINFRDTATIRNEEGKAVTSYGIPNSVSKDQFRNAGNTYDTIFDINAQEIQPEVKEIFSKNSGISEIGNENEYAQYVAETYPNHKLLYHGTESVTPFDEFNYNKEGTHSGSKQAAWWRLDENAWYDQNKDLSQIPQEIGDRIFPVALDTTDYIKGNDFLIAEYLDIPEEIYSEIYNSNKNATDDFKKLAITFYNDGTITKKQAIEMVKANDISYLQKVTGKKGYYYENQLESPGEISYVSFNPKDYTKLGSKKDVEGFKNWKKNKNLEISDNDPLKKIFHNLSPEYSAEENETIANLIEDIREEKIKLWQSPEGERRLQLLIDNTPELAGHTPKSFVQSVQQLENLNGFYQSEKELTASLNADYDQLEIALNEGKISKRDFQQQADQLDEMLLESEALMSEAENLFEKHAGFYAADANLMGVRPGEFKSKDLPIVVDHEFGHKINSFGKGKTTAPSYLDDELAKLDLVDANAGQLEIPGLVDAAPGMYGMMAPGKNYIDKSINYFLNKSNGTEKVPFLSEIRRDLLQQGIINSAYDKITPKMLRDRYKDYKKTTGEKFPLRLYDIVKDKPQNFNIMSKVINNLPAILSAVGMTDAFLNEDDPNVNQAGLSLLIGAIGKGKLKAKGAKLKSLSKKTTQALAFRDKQLKRITNKLTDDILAHEQAWDLKIQDVNPTLSLFHNEVENIKNKLPNNLESYGIDHDLLMKDYVKQVEIAKAEKNIPNIQVTDEGLVAERKSPLANVTAHGESIITSFATGDKVSSTVTMPGYSTSYKPKGKELEIINKGTSNPIISPKYVATLQGNIDYVEMTGAKVYGSAVGVTQGGLPHLTGDIDALILDKDYVKNVQNKLEYVTSKGPAQVHDIGIGDVDGHIDFNIIHTNPNGTIKVNWTANPMTGEKRSLELELFRQFFPDEYYAEQKRIIEKFGTKINKSANTTGINLIKHQQTIDPADLGFEINIPAQEFMDKIDPAVKTVMDAYESSKDKHINKIDIYINYGDVNVVKKAQEAYVKSLVGSKGSLGPQLSKEALSDVKANRQALQEMGFIGDIDVVAENPERMQLALDDYYINNTIHNRQVKTAKSLKDIENAFKKWSPEFGGGHANGFGLNTVKLGDPNHWQGEILGNIQYKIDINTSSPVDYVKSVKFATTGSIPFTPEQKEIVKDIIKQYSGIHYDERVGNLISSPKDVIDIHNPIFRGMAQSGDINVQRNLQKLYNEITKRLGVRSTGLSEQHTYGNAYYSSILGEFEEAKDLLQYSIITTALKPKSLVQRRTNYKYLSNITPNEIDPDLIKTLGDYQKIENLINGGLEKSKQRSLQIQETIKHLDELVKEKSERYAAKRNPKLKAEVDKAKKELEDYDEQYKKLKDEILEYSRQIDDIKKFRQVITPVLLSAGVVGTVGAVMYKAMTNPSSERHGRPQVIDSLFQTDELSRKEKAYVNRYLKSKGNLKGFTWPDGTGIQSHHTVGEGLLLENPHLKPPKERFKQGGSIELELTPQQIQEYVAKGYIVEEQ